MTHSDPEPVGLTALHVPDWRKGNPYQSLLGAALEAQGVGVRWSGIPQGLFALNRLGPALDGVQVVHVHWSNDLVGAVVWDTNPIKRALRLALLVADVALMRLRGRRIVWTVHNLVTHESADPAAEIRARRLLARSCNRLIVHSASALRRIEQVYGLRLQHKASVIPHGNYAGIYPPDLARARAQALRAEFGLDADAIVLLFFGAIRAYKRVPQLVEAFRRTKNPRLRLIIVGSARPPELAQEIQDAAAGDRRIHFRPGFVPDSDVKAYFDLADAVLVPLERSLTSGSVVLAMTLHKATFLHEEGRVFDLIDDASGCFYRSSEEFAQLMDRADKTTLALMGAAAGASMSAHDWPAVAAATAAVYA